MPPPIFKENDLVWIQALPSLNIEDCSKLAPCKYGPYKIIDVLNNHNFKIDIKRSPFSKTSSYIPCFGVRTFYSNTSKVFKKKNS